jgi:hypothetical protein
MTAVDANGDGPVTTHGLDAARFATEITVTGPYRAPAQMLEEQEVDGHASIHDGDTADTLGLDGAPIEAPTHFSQFDPLAVALWGPAWFERGCISSHFRTMVVEGEEVQASIKAGGALGPRAGRIEAHKADGTPVLAGSVSLGPDHPPTALDERRSSQAATSPDENPGDLFIVDQLQVGARDEGETASMTHEDRNGRGYPFSLADKLDRITEPHPWYTPEGGARSPWGAAVVPMEMISVLAHKAGPRWPVRGPALGLFLDMEIKLLDGPVLVGRDYALSRELIGLSQSRRTESYWTRTTLTDTTTGRPTAVVVLHSGVFKESYAGYPKDRLV